MAGFDPATFWGLTLRRYKLFIQAAQKREGLAQARAAEAAFVGTRADHKGLMQFIDAVTGIDRTLPASAFPAALKAASRNLPTITRAEFLKMRESRDG